MGVWIEIDDYKALIEALRKVTPFMGVWIEIQTHQAILKIMIVTPFMGVWIEIAYWGTRRNWSCVVTPFMGVWIEIQIPDELDNDPKSLPSWECGLKSWCYCAHFYPLRHSLHGSVD